MSKITYQIVSCPKEVDKAVALMRDEIDPLFFDFWEAKGKPFYKEDYSLGIFAFTQMWNLKTIKLVVAYQDNKPVGFLLGISFSPILFASRNIIQIEACYGDTSEIEKGLFDYFMTLTPILEIDEVWISSDAGLNYKPEWEKRNTITVDRYVKE